MGGVGCRPNDELELLKYLAKRRVSALRNKRTAKTYDPRRNSDALALTLGRG